MDEQIRPRAIPAGSKPRVMMLHSPTGAQHWRCRGEGVATYGRDMDEAVLAWAAVQRARASARAGHPFEVRL